MGYALKYQQELETLTCCVCGVEFAAPMLFVQKRCETHEDFYCPSGHGQAFLGETEAEKLRKQLTEEKRLRSEEIEKRWATENKLAKVTKRASAGLCQHCNRTFSNVVRHLKSKHGGKAAK